MSTTTSASVSASTIVMTTNRQDGNERDARGEMMTRSMTNDKDNRNSKQGKYIGCCRCLHGHRNNDGITINYHHSELIYRFYRSNISRHTCHQHTCDAQLKQNTQINRNITHNSRVLSV